MFLIIVDPPFDRQVILAGRTQKEVACELAIKFAEYEFHDVIVIEVPDNDFEGAEILEILRTEGLNKEIENEDHR